MDNKHAFHDLLAGDFSWAPLFMRWESLIRQIQDLEKARVLETGLGDRNRRLTQIYKRLAALREEIGETQPAERYLFNDAKVICDAWKEFVDHWRRLQHKAGSAIGPQGQRLRDDEKTAWETLIKGRK